MALPLWLDGIMSTMLPLPIVKTATPEKPAKKRNAISMPIFVASAQAMVKTVNVALQM